MLFQLVALAFKRFFGCDAYLGQKRLGAGLHYLVLQECRISLESFSEQIVHLFLVAMSLMVCVCVVQVLLEESAELIEASIPLQKCLQELCKPVVIAKAKMDDALEVGEAIASTTKVLGEQHLKRLT
jgi:hypothetical protein